MTQKNPPVYTDGLGELIRAHRRYISVSERTMAKKLGIVEKSLSDIEIGRRSCPPGFLDSVRVVIEEFEGDVNDLTARSAEMGAALDPHIHVTADSEGEWHRAVIGRAAVQSGRLTPVLIANDRERVNGGWEQ